MKNDNNYAVELNGIREIFDRYKDFYANNLYTYHREAALQILKMYTLLKTEGCVSRTDKVFAERAYLSLHGGSASYYSCESLNEELIDALLYKFNLKINFVIPEYPSGYVSIDEIKFIDKYCILLDETKFDDLREKYAEQILEFRASGSKGVHIRIAKYYAKMVDAEEIEAELEKYTKRKLLCELDPDYGPKIKDMPKNMKSEAQISLFQSLIPQDMDIDDDEPDIDDSVDASSEVSTPKKGGRKKNQAKLYIEISQSSKKLEKFKTCVVRSMANPTIRGGMIKLKKGSILAQMYGLEKPTDAESIYKDYDEVTTE